MPNVVGLTEADAVSKMRSMEFIVWVLYEDGSSEKEGICIMQEFKAGQP